MIHVEMAEAPLRRVHPTRYEGYQATRFRRRYGRSQGIPAHLGGAVRAGGAPEHLGQISSGLDFGSILSTGAGLYTSTLQNQLQKKELKVQQNVGLAQIGSQTTLGVEAEKTKQVVGVAQSGEGAATKPYLYVAGALAVAATAAAFFFSRRR